MFIINYLLVDKIALAIIAILVGIALWVLL